MSFPATIDQYKGIQSVLDSPHITLDTEFMDCKRFPMDKNKASFKQRLLFKLNKAPRYDAVIASDDDALRFVIENQNTLFYHIPIFFLGVNDAQLGLAQNQNKWVSGILERPSFEATIDLMLKLFHNHRKIYIVCDHTLTGKHDYNDLMRLLPRYKGLQFETIWSDDYSSDGFAKKLASLDQTIPLLFEAAYINKNDSLVCTFDESVRFVCSHFGGPVFSTWTYGVMSGALGGNVISFFQHGHIIGNMVKQVLDGADLSKIKVIADSPYQYMFNYEVMKKFNISMSQLPEDTKYINRTLNIYEQNKTFVLSAAIFIVLLIVLIFFLLRSYYLKKDVLKSLALAKVKAEEEDKMRTDFIRNMSHEIKTPLNSISGFTGLISASTNSEKVSEHYISLVKDNVGQLRGIISKVFEILSLDNKSECLDLKQISVVHILEEQYMAYRAFANDKGLEFVLDSNEKDIVFVSDAERIAKIVDYLLENAIKFTLHGNIHLGCYEEEDMVIIYVKDTGIGISKEQEKVIFNQFIQGDDQLSRKYGGIGLGLSIAKEIAILLGGEITLDSEVEKGTTFYVKLPHK
jgi:signal transduction histidine kinase